MNNNDNNKTNNTNNENQTIINIPGVIIPPQKTENGTVISSTVDDRNEVQKEKDASTVNSAVPNSNPAPRPEDLIPSGDMAPVDPTKKGILNASSVNTTNASSNVSSNNANSVNASTTPLGTLPINDSSLPPVTTTELDKHGKPIKKKKKKSVGTIMVNSSLVGIIVLLLMAIGYFVYNDYLKPKPKVDLVKEYQRKRIVNKNSYIVNMLYDFVNLDGCGEQISFFYGSNNSVNLSNLTDENKNYLAYRMLLNKSFSTKNCATYPKALHSNNPLGLWYCGSYDETGKEEETRVFSSKDLKNIVERMFGDGTYKAKSFSVSASARFMYNETNDNYVYQTFNGDNRCTPHTNTLVSASMQGDNLTIVVKVTNNENKNESLFHYTFTETDDGNYYFNNLTITGV